MTAIPFYQINTLFKDKQLVDTIKGFINVDTPTWLLDKPPEAIQFMGHDFWPIWVNGRLTKYMSIQDGLRLTLAPSGKLYVANSLHKFYKGNNYSDFNFSEVKESVDVLANTIGFNPKDLILTRVDFGVNITANPIPEARNWKGILTREAEPIKSRVTKRIVGSKIELADWSIKIYDKKREVYDNDGLKIDGPLTRIEASINRLRSIQKRSSPINIYSLDDLKSPNVMKQLATDLMTKYRSIEKANSLDWESLSWSQIKVALITTHPEFRQLYNQVDRNTLKRLRADYRAIKRKHRLSSLEGLVGAKIEQLSHDFSLS